MKIFFKIKQPIKSVSFFEENTIQMCMHDRGTLTERGRRSLPTCPTPNRNREQSNATRKRKISITCYSRTTMRTSWRKLIDLAAFFFITDSFKYLREGRLFAIETP